MKVDELREYSDLELQHKEEDLKEELFNLRFQKSMNRLENPMRIKKVKKTIARIKTILGERIRNKEVGNE